MNIIETHDLTKIYTTGLKKGNIVALDSVSLKVKQGEVFGLLGPNGAGKTTMVKSLIGIIGVTSGEVLVNGLTPGDPTSREKAGFLPENHRFPSHLTGLGLLELAGRLSKMSQEQIDQRTEILLPLVGMEKWANTKIRKYSKGMSQRIGLAQALITDPDIVFLDEPTDGIDPIGKAEIRAVLERLRDAGKTIFLNSHLLSEVEAIADRVAILQRGRLIKLASVEELTTVASQYQIEADIGNETINIPEEIGKKLSLTAKGMIVLLNEPEHINQIIDQLRMRKITIRSVQPMKQSLEQSFMDVVSDRPEQSI